MCYKRFVTLYDKCTGFTAAIPGRARCFIDKIIKLWNVFINVKFDNSVNLWEILSWKRKIYLDNKDENIHSELSYLMYRERAVYYNSPQSPII